MSFYVKTLLSAALLTGLLFSPAYGQEADGFDDGFSDSFDLDTDTPEVSLDLSDLPQSDGTEDDFWGFTGFLRQDYHVSFAKIDPVTLLEIDPYASKFRTTLNLNWESKLGGSWQAKANFNAFYDAAYFMSGYTNFYSLAVIESMEAEVEVRDFYLEGDLEQGLTLKVGRQIVAWGQSQTSQLNDMVNPRDNREMGLIDVEDARLPVLALNIGFEALGANVNVVRVMEHRGNKQPGAGSEFDMYAGLAQALAAVPVAPIEPEGGPLFYPEMFVRMEWQMNGGDVSIYVADAFDDQPHLKMSNLFGVVLVRPEYNRIQSFGFSANKTFGSWMVRGEFAQKSNVESMRSDFANQIITGLQGGVVNPLSIQKTIVSMAASVEYTGLSDIMISLELGNEFIRQYEAILVANQDSGSSTFMFSHDSFHQTWHNRLFVFGLGSSMGARFDSTYDTDTEGLTVGLGAMIYHSTDTTSPLYGFRNNDRAYASAKYSF